MTDADSDVDAAAVVVRERTDEAVTALRQAGVYDDTRRIEPHDEDTVAIPVVLAPDAASVAALDPVDRVEHVALPTRRRGLDDLLRDRDWTDAEIARAPSSWAVLGSVVLATFDDVPDESAVGEALLQLHSQADTVLARESIDGPTREPSVRVVAGEGDTETVHVEHGVRYGLDLAEVMFSPGNKAERARMGDVVAPDETVFDMFAGVGYFTLPMAVADARVTAAEIRPAAFRHLVENAALNDVTDRISPFRADCRDVAVDDVDRVVMGHYDAADYLPTAMDAVAPGGSIHLHAATPEAEIERPENRLHEAAADAGRGATVTERRRVKSHSEGVAHVVVDAVVE
jgi:tRNA wybutosine-synthesizing protein 2